MHLLALGLSVTLFVEPIPTEIAASEKCTTDSQRVSLICFVNDKRSIWCRPRAAVTRMSVLKRLITLDKMSLTPGRPAGIALPYVKHAGWSGVRFILTRYFHQANIPRQHDPWSSGVPQRPRVDHCPYLAIASLSICEKSELFIAWHWKSRFSQKRTCWLLQNEGISPVHQCEILKYNSSGASLVIERTTYVK